MPVLERRKTLSQPSTAFHLLAITLLWGLAMLLVNYQGNFPLNDDWSYGIAVQRLVEEGDYKPTAWTSMSLISQVLWGGLFCYLFGFSFEVLRLSTLVLSLLTLFSVYLIVKQLNKSGGIALFVTLLIAFNPIYFALSYTFMTDIPFLGFITISLLFFLRYLENEALLDLIIGTVFAAVAVLCRQTGLYVPIAFALTILYQHGFKVKILPVVILPGLFCLGVLLGYQFWLEQTARTPELYGKQMQDLVEITVSPGQWPMTFAKSILIAIMYLGLFLLPVFAMLLGTKTTHEPARWFKKWLTKAIGPVSVLLGIAVFLGGKWMPLGGNVISQEGIGPLTLYDVYTLDLPNVAALSPKFWTVVTVMSVIGAATLLVYLFSIIRWAVVTFRQQQHAYHHYVTFFLLAGGVVYFMPILFLGYYDRYLLTPLVLIALILALDQTSLPTLKLIVPGVALLFLIAIYSVAGTHDYLSWNRVRWQALRNFIEKEDVPYHQIDGGFEYNGFALYTDESLRAKKSDKWWTEEDNEYAITFGKVKNYEVVRAYKYDRWLPPSTGKILLLKQP